jgi:hypothetical protein
MRKLCSALFVTAVVLVLSGCDGDRSGPSFFSVGKKIKEIQIPNYTLVNVTIISDKGAGWYEVQATYSGTSQIVPSGTVINTHTAITVLP